MKGKSVDVVVCGIGKKKVHGGDYGKCLFVFCRMGLWVLKGKSYCSVFGWCGYK